MTQWRIRAVVPDGPGGDQALQDALATFPGPKMRLVRLGADQDGPTGDVVVELSEESSLPDLLHALHEISPQVFVSRVSADEIAQPAQSGIRIRRLRSALSTVRG